MIRIDGQEVLGFHDSVFQSGQPGFGIWGKSKMSLDFHDDTFSSGSAGLRSWGKSEVSFEDVRVSESD